eukprot:FR740442.1.p1 GENE.FR740442.1~~FR740442.1.p1  ORF type:complete len:110 (-),score=50.20 FR740442.1:946-1245(-)
MEGDILLYTPGGVEFIYEEKRSAPASFPGEGGEKGGGPGFFAGKGGGVWENRGEAPGGRVPRGGKPPGFFFKFPLGFCPPFLILGVGFFGIPFQGGGEP